MQNKSKDHISDLCSKLLMCLVDDVAVHGSSYVVQKQKRAIWSPARKKGGRVDGA
jgi:hypothetical protein